MSTTKRKPWRKFYPQDWRADHLLRQCSPAARGVWIDLLCIAWMSHQEGYLVNPDGSAMDTGQIAKSIGEQPAVVTRAIEELERTGTVSRSESGILYSRRIVREVEASELASRNGRLGGNPRLKGGGNGSDKGGLILNSPGTGYAPSVSVSVSASDSSGWGSAEGETTPAGPSFLAFWHAYPPTIRTKYNECLAAWGECMTEGHDPALIVAKAREYGESEQGRGEFAVGAPRFLTARMFLDPPEAWRDSSPKAKRIDGAAIAANVAAKIAKENCREH